jgi:hypothetical protein
MTLLRGDRASERNDDRPEQLLEILPHGRLLRDAFFRFAAFAIEAHYRVGRMRFTVMAVTTRNHENADTMIASAFMRERGEIALRALPAPGPKRSGNGSVVEPAKVEEDDADGVAA